MPLLEPSDHDSVNQEDIVDNRINPSHPFDLLPRGADRAIRSRDLSIYKG